MYNFIVFKNDQSLFTKQLFNNQYYNSKTKFLIKLDCENTKYYILNEYKKKRNIQ